MVKKHIRSTLNKKKIHKVRKNKTKKHMKGGMKLNISNISDIIFVPKGVPFVPPGGSATTGDAYPHKYYSLSSDLHAPNNFLQQGGASITEPLVHLGRSFAFNVQHLYNQYVGQPTPISSNPNPLKQGLDMNPKLNVDPLDIKKIINDAETKVANISSQ